MSSENIEQQRQRSPRARHKHSKSGAGHVSESNIPSKQSGNTQKKGNRRNQGRPVQAQSAWQNSAPQQLEGYFDNQGNFVSQQQVHATQTPGMFYISNTQQSQPAQHANRPTRRPPQTKNASQINGAGTPPRTTSDTDQYFHTSTPQIMTPAKAAAYAGPTFHASPAANSLPIPKFFSKSVPSDPSQPGLQARLENETTSNGNNDFSRLESPNIAEAAPAIPVPERATESPLDIFFKADREQKAQRHSVGPTLTPPATKVNGTNGFFNSEPRPNNFQSIYGDRNHHRHRSNGSGRDMFVMEMDGKEGSNPAQTLSPPPPMPRLGMRSVSDQYIQQIGSGQGHAQERPHPDFYQGHQQMTSIPSLHNVAPNQGPPIDTSYSPFNRAPVYANQQGSDATSMPEHNGQSAGSKNLHYGNRNLSPLFQAAKQSPAPRPGSGLRQEIHPHSPSHMGAVELPDNGSAFRENGNKHFVQSRSNSHADQQAMHFLQSQAPHTTTMPQIPLPKPVRTPSGEATSISTGVTPSGAYGANTKSIEDDLKRMLKLTGGIK